MSYITSSLSPYRSDNLWKEFAGILKGSMDNIESKDALIEGNSI